MKNFVLVIIGFIMLSACESKPKVIVADTPSGEESATIGMEESASTSLHKVVVEEVLPTEKYSYLRVKENGEEFWIAIPKGEVETGGTYYYRGGLKKTNFKSQEYDRVFETVYLVSGVSKDPGMNEMTGNPHQGTSNTATNNDNSKIGPPAGGITISELISNKKNYEGKTVKIQGRVVKLNNMIMNRNWVHLQDASIKNEQGDLTVTTKETVVMGDIVAFEGKISLNKDFGAGYKYEIIMEDAQIIR